MILIKLLFKASDLLGNLAPNVANGEDNEDDRDDEVVDLHFVPDAAPLTHRFRQVCSRRPYVDVEETQGQDAVVTIDELVDVDVCDGQCIG